MITAIYARNNQGIIGVNNDIPWSIKEDFEHFKEITSGGTIIMGKNTWDSLPIKPLPDRRNIIITSQQEGSWNKDAELISSLEDIPDDCFIIGGSQLYNSTMDIVECIKETVIDIDIEKNSENLSISYAPVIKKEDFELVQESPIYSSVDRISNNKINFFFRTWRRI